MPRYNDLETAIKAYIDKNHKHISLSKEIRDALSEDFDYINERSENISDDEFNDAIDEIIINAYTTQAYSEKENIQTKNDAIQYDIVIDVDGVLNDLHYAMMCYLQKKGYNFKIHNIRTYNFNKGKPDTEEFDLGVSRDIIFETLSDIEIFKQAPIEWDGIFMIRKMAYNDMKIAIYTLSPNKAISDFKRKMLECLFFGFKNIDIIIRTMTDNEEKPALVTKSVIEDCLANLTDYDTDTIKCLINKPYNQIEHNPEYESLFNSSNFIRCQGICESLKYIERRLSQ